MKSPFEWISEELQHLEQRHLLRQVRQVTSHPGGKCALLNEANGSTLWNFSANDYLGLSEDSRVLEAARAALLTDVGAKASPLVTGRTEWHAKLESRLASFKGVEAAILFPTGFAANLGTVASLVGPEDVVFTDRLNHASLIDGARYSRARLRVFPHCDTQALINLLRRETEARRRLILTDSLFSMDGDVAPLADLANIAEETGAMLLVDEAHATGIFGARGTGLLEATGVSSPNVIAVGTLSKALGGQGGFVAGTRERCDWLWNTSRTSMFSTALAIPLCAAALRAIQIVEEEPHRREWLLKQSALVAETLRAGGWNVPESVVGPILPVLIGDPQEVLQLAASLLQAGILVAAIRPPTVPLGTSRLRISLSYAHGEAGVDALVQAFSRLEPPAASKNLKLK